MKPTIILKPVLRCSERMVSVADDRQLNVQQHRCFYCGNKMKQYPSDDHNHYSDRITKDHFFPKSHGFALVGNKVFSCAKCNNKKQVKYPDKCNIYEFVSLHGRLVGKKNLKKLLVSTHNHKPRFKLKMTAEVIQYYTSEPLIRN